MNMRLLILAADFKPSLGGIAEYTHQMALHLQQMGDDVLVLARPAPGDVAFDAGCPYAVQRALLHPSQKPPFIARVRQLGAVASSFGADLILANAPLSEPLAGRAVAWRHRLPFAIVVYGQELYNYVSLRDLPPLVRFKKQLVTTVSLRRADLVIAISRFTRSLLQELGVKIDGIAIIPPAVDPDALHAQLAQARAKKVTLPLPAEHPILLTVSRLVERKGIDVTLQALPAVIEKVPDVRYVIVGAGPDRARLERQVAEQELTEHVRFAGRVSDAEKVLYYDAADVFVMPNRTLPNEDVEGFGIVFLEANAFGKPVIAGRSGGAVDAVVDGVTGLLVDPQDARKVSQAILALLRDSDYAERLGRQGKRRVEEELTWVKSAHKLRHRLTSLISQ
ncbi:MAG: glycosyltransferase family 4 protein [Candidatus Promineifilaceae bacterium]|nr:glycosyltransferase family 4 protein [Candidatus Promineifilaceae bacterium]